MGRAAEAGRGEGYAVDEVPIVWNVVSGCGNVTAAGKFVDPAANLCPHFCRSHYRPVEYKLTVDAAAEGDPTCESLFQCGKIVAWLAGIPDACAHRYHIGRDFFNGPFSSG